MTGRSYLQHGRRHAGIGSDGIPCQWHILDLSVGDWTNVGSPKPDSRWCFVPGYDPDTDDPKIEIELAVTGGTPGTLIANLGITFSTDKPVKMGSDSTGTPAPYTVKANGDIFDGAA